MSKQIPLTQGKVALVDDADCERLNRHKWYAYEHGAIWYAVRNNPRKNGKQTKALMHREILKPPTGTEIDHKDGNGLNNQRENLRPATTAQNHHNQRKRKGTTSRYKGVYWHRLAAKWMARIGVNNRRIHLGVFLSETQAALAYDRAALKHFGDFANTNFLQEKRIA